VNTPAIQGPTHGHCWNALCTAVVQTRPLSFYLDVFVLLWWTGKKRTKGFTTLGTRQLGWFTIRNWVRSQGHLWVTTRGPHKMHAVLSMQWTRGGQRCRSYFYIPRWSSAVSPAFNDGRERCFCRCSISACQLKVGPRRSLNGRLRATAELKDGTPARHLLWC